MIAFQIELNGQQLCIAGVDDQGVLTAITSHKASNQRLFLNVGGLLSHPERAHASWSKQSLSIGDQISIKVVDVDPDTISQPVEKTIEQDDLVEQQERRYFEKLKQKYEPAA